MSTPAVAIASRISSSPPIHNPQGDTAPGCEVTGSEFVRIAGVAAVLMGGVALASRGRVAPWSPAIFFRCLGKVAEQVREQLVE